MSECNNGWNDGTTTDYYPMVADGTIAIGQVLKVSSIADNRVGLTTTVGFNGVIGVAGSSATIGNKVKLINNRPAQVLMATSVSKGDFLKSSATAGSADAQTNPGIGNFGIALQTGISGALINFVFLKSENF